MKSMQVVHEAFSTHTGEDRAEPQDEDEDYHEFGRRSTVHQP